MSKRIPNDYVLLIDLKAAAANSGDVIVLQDLTWYFDAR